MQPPKEPLDNLLDRWGQSTPSSEPLESEVWRRIAAADNPDNDSPEVALGFLARIKAVFARPSFSIAFATACVLLGLFLVELRNSRQQAQHNLQLVQSYLRLVDPLLASNPGATDPHASDNLDALLTWMKNDLQLNDQQLARIKNVHQQRSPHLLALASQVAQMQQSLIQFENERASDGRVDFLEFARFVEQRRKLDLECNESTRRLIAESSDVMTPQQREQYLQLLDPALKTTGGGSL
ncbi:MAG: hypothetical protein IPP19_07950 [Verrucomicrobia bacterium]|nr:hypothetical protein [Verrucomicrobiota bacterium]